jgi:hypothetical protein
MQLIHKPMTGNGAGGFHANSRLAAPTAPMAALHKPAGACRACAAIVAMCINGQKPLLALVSTNSDWPLSAPTEGWPAVLASQ